MCDLKAKGYPETWWLDRVEPGPKKFRFPTGGWGISGRVLLVHVHQNTTTRKNTWHSVPFMSSFVHAMVPRGCKIFVVLSSVVSQRPESATVKALLVREIAL